MTRHLDLAKVTCTRDWTAVAADRPACLPACRRHLDSPQFPEHDPDLPGAAAVRPYRPPYPVPTQYPLMVDASPQNIQTAGDSSQWSKRGGRKDVRFSFDVPVPTDFSLNLGMVALLIFSPLFGIQINLKISCHKKMKAHRFHQCSCSLLGISTSNIPIITSPSLEPLPFSLAIMYFCKNYQQNCDSNEKILQ